MGQARGDHANVRPNCQDGQPDWWTDVKPGQAPAERVERCIHHGDSSFQISTSPLTLVRHFALLGVTALMLPTTSHAQSAGLSSTTFVRAITGIGWAGPAAEANIDRRTGPVASLGIEHIFTPYLRGLAQVTRWQSIDSPASSLTFGMATVELFPVEGTDAYVRGGFGYGAGSLYAPDVALGGGSYSIAGPALDVGVGYDYRTASRFSVGTFVAGTNTIGGTAKSKVRLGTGEGVLIFTGLSFTGWP